MRQTHHRAGFSLMEINMAVFVMAIGILGMVALFPLGLHEAIQGRADLKQSMFADHALNQLIALLSQTNVYWSEWVDLNHTAYPKAVSIMGDTWPKATFPQHPDFDAEKNLDLLARWKVGGEAMKPEHYRVFFDRVGGPSSKIMGIGVRSTEIDENDYVLYTNNVLYYAEVLFQGDATH